VRLLEGSVTRAVAILDVQWGPWNRASRYFRINPRNRSGARLYYLLGHNDLMVTNACPEIVPDANGRGKPSPQQLLAALLELRPFELLLVCGVTAQKTYALINIGVHPGPFAQFWTVYMPHPAARLWTNERKEFAKKQIREAQEHKGPQVRYV
jgi:hypothetical protein